MEGTLLHHRAPMYHVKVRVSAILTTPKIGGVPHHALEQRIPHLTSQHFAHFAHFTHFRSCPDT